MCRLIKYCTILLTQNEAKTSYDCLYYTGSDISQIIQIKMLQKGIISVQHSVSVPSISASNQQTGASDFNP